MISVKDRIIKSWKDIFKLGIKSWWFIFASIAIACILPLYQLSMQDILLFYIFAPLLSIPLALIYSIKKGLAPLKIEFEFSQGLNTKIIIKFGDLFEQDGIISMATDEVFDSSFENNIVSKNGVLGQFIQKFYDGNNEEYDKDINNFLNKEPKRKPKRKPKKINRKLGKDIKYPLGTTISLKRKSKKFYNFVLTRVNKENAKVSADITDLWTALIEFWRFVQIDGNDEIISIPLVGTGYADINLPVQQIVEIILDTIYDISNEGKITSKIQIIIHKKFFKKLDLTIIKNQWKIK